MQEAEEAGVGDRYRSLELQAEKSGVLQDGCGEKIRVSCERHKRGMPCQQSRPYLILFTGEQT